jgi:D-amino-acid dehydrogenase
MLEGLQSLHDLNHASQDLFNQLIKGESLACDYHQHGWLMLYKTEQGFQKAQENAALLKSYSIPSKVLNAEVTLKMEETVHPKISGSVFFLEDANLDPTRFILSLADRLRKRGVVIRENVKVLGFEISEDLITTVRTIQGDIKPGHVVLAAGAWSAELMRALKLRLPVQPAKGYSISIKRKKEYPKIPLYLSEAKVAVNLLGDSLRFAGILELAGMDSSVNRRRVDDIMNTAEGYLKITKKFDVIEARTGLRPCSPDGLPIIDRSTDYKNLVVATGHGMLGITQAPITGKLVSQLVCEQTPDINLTPFRLARFE